MSSCSGRSIASIPPSATPLRTIARLTVVRSSAQRPAGVPLGALLRSLRAPALVPSQQSAGFQHSAICAAAATTDAPPETFQYQAEVSPAPKPWIAEIQFPLGCAIEYDRLRSSQGALLCVSNHFTPSNSVLLSHHYEWVPVACLVVV